MIITVNELVGLLDELIPPSMAEDWDNVGLMLGRGDKKIRRIMLALDLTKETAEQAIANKADVIITHHPAIFRPLKNVTDKNWQQDLLLQMAEQGIAVYSAHTNFDCTANGVNYSLAKRLQLQDDDVLDANTGLGRIGLVNQCGLATFAKRVKQALGCEYVTYADAGRLVRKVAVCGGAGSDLIQMALSMGADTLVTGDVKYHSAQEAAFSGLNIIDAGHQTTERPALSDLADRLSLRFTEREWDVIISVANESLLIKHV